MIWCMVHVWVPKARPTRDSKTNELPVVDDPCKRKCSWNVSMARQNCVCYKIAPVIWTVERVTSLSAKLVHQGVHPYTSVLWRASVVMMQVQPNCNMIGKGACGWDVRWFVISSGNRDASKWWRRRLYTLMLLFVSEARPWLVWCCKPECYGYALSVSVDDTINWLLQPKW
jgi:hypothetical protein